ncbi:MAG: hypothetical protein AAF849_15435 [Bacteroidota bacterium]
MNEYRPKRTTLFFSEEQPILYLSFPEEFLISEKNIETIEHIKSSVESSFHDLVIICPALYRYKNEKLFQDLAVNLETIKKTTYFIHIALRTDNTSTSMVELA